MYVGAFACSLLGGAGEGTILRANAPDLATQPSVRQISVHPWMPKHRQYESRHIERQDKGVHVLSQSGRVTFWDRGNELRFPRQSQSSGESVHDHGNRSLQPGSAHGAIDVCAVEPPSRHMDVLGHNIAVARHLSLCKRMTVTHDADPSILEQRGSAHFGRCRPVDDASLDVHLAFT